MESVKFKNFHKRRVEIAPKEVFDIDKHYTKTKKEIKYLAKLKEYEETQWMVENGKLSTGQNFGQQALNNDERQNSTMKAVNNCYFMCLDQQDYNKILRKIFLRIQNQKIDFFSSMPFFRQQSQTRLKMLINMFTEQTCHINHVLFKQGTVPKFVYIIK